MGTCKGTFPPRIPQKQHRPLALQTMNCTPADYQLQKSMEQTTNRNRARLPSLFGMKFTQVPSQYSKGIGEVKATIKVWVRAKAPSRRVSTQAVPPFGSSNNELHSCRLSIAEKRGANNQQEQSKAPLTVRYEIHTSPRQEYGNRFAEQTMLPNNSVVFHLIMVQRNGEKWSWITSGSHTLIDTPSTSLHPTPLERRYEGSSL
jgi:hypothetical protein